MTVSLALELQHRCSGAWCRILVVGLVQHTPFDLAAALARLRWTLQQPHVGALVPSYDTAEIAHT